MPTNPGDACSASWLRGNMATGWSGEVESAMDKSRPSVCLIRSVRDLPEAGRCWPDVRSAASGAGFTSETFQGWSRETSSGRNLSATKRPSSVSSALVDDAHTPAAELLDDAVARNGLTDHVVDVLTAANPSAAAGQCSVGRSECRTRTGLLLERACCSAFAACSSDWRVWKALCVTRAIRTSLFIRSRCIARSNPFESPDHNIQLRCSFSQT